MVGVVVEVGDWKRLRVRVVLEVCSVVGVKLWAGGGIRRELWWWWVWSIGWMWGRVGNLRSGDGEV